MDTKNKAKEQLDARVMASKSHLWSLALLAAAVILAYANSLTGTWALDDVITNKPVTINDIRDLVGFRKVTALTFLFNQAIAPFSPASFRAVNILIHILNSFLVYTITFMTVSSYLKSIPPRVTGKRDNLTSIPSTGTAWTAALFAGVLFALHPININAVAYIVQRMASLATLFVLLALLSYIIASRLGGYRTIILYSASALLILAGIFSKENAVMAVPLIVLYDYVFLARPDMKSFRFRMVWVSAIGILSLGAASYFLRFHATFWEIGQLFLNPTEVLTPKAWTAIDVYWSPLQHILTEFRVIARYLFLIVLPLPKFFVFDWWGFPISRGLATPYTTLLSMALVFSVLTFAVWKIRRFPMICFGILWYFIAISLESFLAPGADLYFEHRNYLPVAGLFMGIAGQAAFAIRKHITDRRVWASAFVVSGVLALLTFSRNSVWKDSVTLWSDTLNKTPANVRAMLAMGNTHLKLSDVDSARKQYEKAVLMTSRARKLQYLDDALYSLGMTYLHLNKFHEAGILISKYEKVIESHRPRILKGFYKASTGDPDGAIQEYLAVLNEVKGIDRVVINSLMGDAYRKKGLPDKSIRCYADALLIDPYFAGAYYGMGVAFLSKKDTDHAYEYFSKSLMIDPDNVMALSDMAELLLIRKAPAEALQYAERGVRKNSAFYQPYLSLGNVLTVLGREKEAKGVYEQAVRKGAVNYMIPLSEARAYYLKGDPEKARQRLNEVKNFKNVPGDIRDMAGD